MCFISLYVRCCVSRLNSAHHGGGSAVPVKTMRDIRDLYESADKNGNGELDREEFFAWLRTVGVDADTFGDSIFEFVAAPPLFRF